MAKKTRTIHAKCHGHAGTRLYTIWRDMRARCVNKNCKRYPDYGGRGITVCDEWRDNCVPFIEWARGNGYSEELTLDRRNNDKGYSPENCRWATRTEQTRNMRNNIILQHAGKEQCVSAWAAELNVPKQTLYSRYRKGWLTERMLTTPVRKRKRKCAGK